MKVEFSNRFCRFLLEIFPARQPLRLPTPGTRRPNPAFRRRLLRKVLSKVGQSLA